MIEVAIKLPDPPKGFVYDCFRRAVYGEYYCKDGEWLLYHGPGTAYEWPVAVPVPPKFDLAGITPGEAQLPMHCVTREGEHVVILRDNYTLLPNAFARWYGMDTYGHAAWQSNGSYCREGLSALDIVGPWEEK